ncbi:alpha/beta hydrolase family protein [Zavarzinella formosa]|uniref:alpha/beta hydrolase family protein n=1 Tax=Zavarzinella formosa TaxID=360055 RepID=UPI0002E6A2DB|nr:alpha/beta hydrolase [Zavarzinella formosa]
MKSFGLIGLFALFLAFSKPLTPIRADEPKPFGGKVSKWNGFAKHDFQVDRKDAIVVVPDKALPGRPWLWRAEFFGAFANQDIELLKKGWHVAYLNVQELYGAPKAVEEWEKFHSVLVKEYGLHPKPGVIGLSRGGMYAMAWGAAHPDKTLAIDLDNAFVNPKDWPGRKAKGPPTREWTNLLNAYGFKSDAEIDAYKGFAADNLEGLAKAKVPILLVYGDGDKVVPHKLNSEMIFDRYKALGGTVEKIVKPGGDHHPHGLPDPKPVVAFFEKAWVDHK